MTDAHAQESTKSKTDQRAIERRARVREQIALLTAASWCTKPHNLARPAVPPVASKALAERMRGAEIEQARRDCEDCARKLSTMSAALVLAVLPSTPTEKLVSAARDLRASQPMTWVAIERMNTIQLEQALRRGGHADFTAAEYQAVAADTLALLEAPKTP